MRLTAQSPFRFFSVVSLIAAALCLASCRDGNGDAERAEGLKLRDFLRDRTPEEADINVAEYEFDQKAKLNLGVLAAIKPDSPNWPTPEQIKVLIGPLQTIEDRRRAIRKSMTDLALQTPLPIALREDVYELLGERISVDEGWRIQLESLMRALELHHEQAVREQTARLIEMFNAYGPLQNALKLAADGIEEQLRLPWKNDPENRPGRKMEQPDHSPVAVPSSSPSSK